MALLDRFRKQPAATISETITQQMGEAIDTTDQEWLRDAADLDSKRIDRYAIYEDYYDGDQGVELTDRAKAVLEQSGLEFNENFCEPVVDTRVQRLRITGFTVDDHDDATAWLTDTWSRGRNRNLAGTVHTAHYVKGDAFVSTTWDNDRNRPKVTFNRPEIMKAVYDEDDTDLLLYIVKKWDSSKRSPTNPDGDDITRLNLYFPDRVEKWFSTDNAGENWAPHLDEDDTSWPVWWTDNGEKDGEPLGILVTHFRHKPRGKRYGRSLLKGVIPQQDELNKQLVDLFYVNDAQGWAWPYITGVGGEEEVKLAVGDILKLASKDAKVGQLPAADPRPVLESIDATIRRVSARSFTPLHLMMQMGSAPTGETLKTAESPLTHALDDSQGEDLGPGWTDVARMQLRLAEVHGEGLSFADADDLVIRPVWDGVETRNEQTEVVVAGSKHDLGVSRHTTLIEMGYDPDEEAKLRAAETLAEAPPPPDGRPAPDDEDPLDNGS